MFRSIGLMALFVPMTYWLDPVAALAAIVTMVACAIFAGDIPTVLLRIPGTPASAYADDVPHEVKQQRLARLQARLTEQAQAVASAMVGTVQRVLARMEENIKG